MPFDTLYEVARSLRITLSVSSILRDHLRRRLVVLFVSHWTNDPDSFAELGDYLPDKIGSGGSYIGIY